MLSWVHAPGIVEGVFWPRTTTATQITIEQSKISTYD